jgi:hypothetical protein
VDARRQKMLPYLTLCTHAQGTSQAKWVVPGAAAYMVVVVRVAAVVRAATMVRVWV